MNIVTVLGMGEGAPELKLFFTRIIIEFCPLRTSLSLAPASGFYSFISRDR